MPIYTLMTLFAALTNPLQILAAQASTSPPVVVNRPHSREGNEAATASGEPEAKRPKMEDDGRVSPVPQPVIVAMNQETNE